MNRTTGELIHLKRGKCLQTRGLTITQSWYGCYLPTTITFDNFDVFHFISSLLDP